MSVKYEVVRNSTGMYYTRHYEFHRLDGPASIWFGTRFWYEYGKSYLWGRGD